MRLGYGGSGMLNKNGDQTCESHHPRQFKGILHVELGEVYYNLNFFIQVNDDVQLGVYLLGYWAKHSVSS